MRRQSLLFIWLFLPLLLLGSRSAAVGDEYGRDGYLLIFVRSNKPVYSFGEPIALTLTLKNGTTAPLFVNKRFNVTNDLRWDLFKDPDGFQPMKPAPAGKPAAGDYLLLKPGEEIEKVFPDLADLVEEKLKKGLYALRITYLNSEKPKGDATWTGVIVSNLLSFKVKSSPNL